MSQLIALDHSIFFSINHSWENPFFNILMPIATHLGEVWWLALLVVPFLYLQDKKHFLRNISLFAMVLLATGIVGRILKYWVDRPRPLREMAVLLESHHVYIHVLGPRLMEYSFPSGHALTAFSAATFLSFQYKRHAVLFFSIAILIGLSRIYVGAHFPSDVLGGAIIATGLTWSVCYFAQKYYFREGS